jgi:hypothetical protein
MSQDSTQKSHADVSKSLFYLEWLECRSSLARFDEMLLDIRKYGFGLCTILLGADGFLLATGTLGRAEAFGIYIALLVLIIGLFRVDRCHEMFVRGAADRAEEIESEHGLQLTTKISEYGVKTGTWGHWLYTSFCTATAVLVLGTFLKFTSLRTFTASVTSEIPLLIMVIVSYAIAVAVVLWHHRSTKSAIKAG